MQIEGKKLIMVDFKTWNMTFLTHLQQKTII